MMEQDPESTQFTQTQRVTVLRQVVQVIGKYYRLSPAAYYAQRMIQYLSRRDSIRQRSMRYQQNRLRSSTSSSSSDNQGPSVEGTDLEFEDFE
ncbi:hypothetical protein J1605_002668 [Eschrichtius robustus]|uniref:Uncharacterized protein n=1 Tax=Eschrichtius robustus TaxID=9764 RepID=A0AB34HY94_ESCRO|nr:hypothetical protein J1605_002668 [Eschrichtius robustus]